MDFVLISIARWKPKPQFAQLEFAMKPLQYALAAPLLKDLKTQQALAAKLVKFVMCQALLALVAPLRPPQLATPAFAIQQTLSALVAPIMPKDLKTQLSPDAQLVNFATQAKYALVAPLRLLQLAHREFVIQPPCFVLVAHTMPKDLKTQLSPVAQLVNFARQLKSALDVSLRTRLLAPLLFVMQLPHYVLVAHMMLTRTWTILRSLAAPLLTAKPTLTTSVTLSSTACCLLMKDSVAVPLPELLSAQSLESPLSPQ
jgi:hypothetical protein